MASISWTRRAGASTALAIAAGCGSSQGIDPASPPAPNQPRLLAPLPLTGVFVLEASGSQPEDTTVTISPGSRRVVVVRRSGPDYGIFARLEFPPPPLGAATASGPTTLTIRPRPGLYALDLGLEGPIVAGAVITFSYGAHFIAPAGARARYGGDLAFERELAIGRVEADGRVHFLPTARPGSDMLTAPLVGPGRYLVAAPR